MMESCVPTASMPSCHQLSRGLAHAFGRPLGFPDQLDVNWRPFSNVADFKDRVAAVVQVLEKNL